MMPEHYRLYCAAILCVALSGAPAIAEAGGYLGVDGSSLTVTNSVEDDINPRGLRLRLGLRVSEMFDVEAHLGGGTDDTTQVFDEFGTGYAALYLKGYLPVGQRSALFALAGGASVEFTQTLRGGEFSDDRSGFSYGFGLETQLSRTLDLSADYIRYNLDDEDFPEVSAVNLGLKWYF